MSINSPLMKRFVLPAALLIALSLFFLYSPHLQDARSHLLRKPYSSKDHGHHPQEHLGLSQPSQPSRPSQHAQHAQHAQHPQKHPEQHSHQNGISLDSETLTTIRKWQEQEGIKKIVGFVFYGRRSQASILDCYLKRNLAKNGGLLDEVVWLQRTENAADVAFLDKLLESESNYLKIYIDGIKYGYATSYDSTRNDTLYVKIDTDIVYIEDTTIMSMIHTRATHPESYVIGANVVNQPMSSWLHWNLGAVRPYLPEQHSFTKPDNQALLDWRASLLPEWSGPEDFDVEKWREQKNEKHRWLPLAKRKDHILDKTPIINATYDAFSDAGLRKWTVAAQQHYSLLESLEKGETWRYSFRTWDYEDKRMGLQFVVITGKDINIAKPIHEDDEDHFTVTMRRELGRAILADGRGLAAHYSLNPQSEGLDTTDVLERYRSYAQEKICQGDILWKSEADDAR